MHTMTPGLMDRCTRQAAHYGCLMLTLAEQAAVVDFAFDHPSATIATRHGVCSWAHIPTYILPNPWEIDQ